jgi:ketosteroid isomerase-like protein
MEAFNMFRTAFLSLLKIAWRTNMKPNLLYVLAILITLCLGVSSGLAQKVKQTPEDAVRSADQAWLKVFAAKDLKASVDFCTADGSVLAPNSPIATGHEAINKSFAGYFAIPGLTIDWKPTRTEVARSGEMAYTTGSYRMGFPGPDGVPAIDTGKYVTVWKKQKDGSWKVFLDIFNSDLPVAGSK